MSNVTTTSRAIRATVQEATTPRIVWVNAPTADTEVFQLLNNNTKKIRVKIKDGGPVLWRYSWVSGGTGAITDEYDILPGNAEVVIEGVNFSGTIYLRSNKSSKTFIIEEWT